RAAYDAAVASYRQTVLDALGEVEDYLVELRTLETELAARRLDILDSTAAVAARLAGEYRLSPMAELPA
ncbi:RND transporter, partial [Azotobacter chroococcum]|nr:RND transporter [Azotobacter chroococcum]